MVKSESWHAKSIWGIGLLAPVVGCVVAYLITAGYWPIALGIVLALPGGILLHKYPFLGLIIWLCLAPFLMNTPTDMLRRVYWIIHRALPPATVAIIVISSLLRVRDHRLPKLGVAELAMAGYLTLSFVSILYLSGNTKATIYLLYDSIFVPMCLYMIIRLSSPNEKDLQRLIPLLFALCIIQALVGALSWTVPQVIPGMWRNHHVGSRTIGTLNNPTTYTLALMFGCVLLLQAAQNRKGGPIRSAYIIAFVVAIFFVFLSFTRSSWLGALMVLVGLLVLYPGFMVRLGLIAALVLSLFGGVLLADQLNRASERLYSSQSEESALSRLPIYYAAFQMFQAKPLFGWGYNNFDRYDRDFQARVGDLVNAQKDHASHNTYLTLLAEQGATGFLLYLTPLFWWLALTRKTLPLMPQKGFWSRKLLIVCWLFLLFFVIVNNFFRVYVVYGLGLYWITLGLIANIIYTQHRIEPQPASNQHSLALVSGSNLQTSAQ